jgi:hypothetical protein
MRSLSSYLLFGHSATDPATYCSVTAPRTLLIVARCRALIVALGGIFCPNATITHPCLWLTGDVDYCWAGIMNCTNPCWVSWRFWKFIITTLRNIKYPFLMYNPWSTKKNWISQIITGSSLKPGSSCKVLIYPKPAVLRSETFEKPGSYSIKIKFAPDTDIGRHEWHAVGAMK